MQSRERYFSLGNVIYPDPTAREAIGNVHGLATLITSISQELRGLNRRRKMKKITRQEYMEQRRPLVTRYKDVNRAHLLTSKGGER